MALFSPVMSCLTMLVRSWISCAGSSNMLVRFASWLRSPAAGPLVLGLLVVSTKLVARMDGAPVEEVVEMAEEVVEAEGVGGDEAGAGRADAAADDDDVDDFDDDVDDDVDDDLDELELEEEDEEVHVMAE